MASQIVSRFNVHLTSLNTSPSPMEDNAWLEPENSKRRPRQPSWMKDYLLTRPNKTQPNQERSNATENQPP